MPYRLVARHEVQISAIQALPHSPPLLLYQFPVPNNLSRMSERRNADLVFTGHPLARRQGAPPRVMQPSQTALSLVRPFIASLSGAKLCPADKSLIFAHPIFVGKYIFHKVSSIASHKDVLCQRTQYLELFLHLLLGIALSVSSVGIGLVSSLSVKAVCVPQIRIGVGKILSLKELLMLYL